MLKRLFRSRGGPREGRAADGTEASGRMVEVGWLIDAPDAMLTCGGPQPVTTGRSWTDSARNPGRCPAIVGHQASLFQLACPLDLHLRLRNLHTPNPVLVNVAETRSKADSQVLHQIVSLMSRTTWADPMRPLVQVSAPWRFVTDDDVWMMQMPPYYHYRREPIPGIMIGGRFPIRVWPRSLMWAFEWQDPERDLVLRRGEPWFYLWFETTHPERRVRLVEAEMTEALREYCNGLDGVAAYVGQTWSLFKTADERRPPRLLHKKGGA